MRRIEILVGVAVLAASWSGMGDAGAKSAPNTSVFAINGEGIVVGTFFNSTSHGFELLHGSFLTLDAPAAANFTEAKGINRFGDVVGDYFDARGNLHGFLLHHGHYTTLDVPGAVNGTNPYQINSGGEIAGFWFDAHNRSHGFLLRNGTYTTFDDPLATAGTYGFGINDAGDVVGAFFQGPHRHGFVLRHGRYTTLDVPDAVATYANGINDSGAVVGGYTDLGGGVHGYVLSNGLHATFDDPGGAFGTPSSRHQREWSYRRRVRGPHPSRPRLLAAERQVLDDQRALVPLGGRDDGHKRFDTATAETAARLVLPLRAVGPVQLSPDGWRGKFAHAD